MWTTAFAGDPNSSAAKWYGRPYGGREDESAVINRYTGLNAYFSVASLTVLEGEQTPRRMRANFGRLLSLVIDDGLPDNVNGIPTWVLETSPQKFQIGFRIDREDGDAADRRLVEAVMKRMVDLGLIGGDPSGNNSVRYVRLPDGENHKPRATGNFICRLRQLNRDAVYSLADAAAAIGIDLDDVRKDLASAPAESAQTGEQDEKLATAASNIMRGQGLHEGANIIAASLIASGARPGAVVNMIRGMYEASLAPRDDRWQARYEDIPRAVETAYQKFGGVTSIAFIDPNTGEVVQKPRFISADEIMAGIKAVDFLVDGYLEMDALSLLYGPSGLGKSFISFDLACCIATGTPWHGKKVKQMPVFMVVGEGANGIGRRLKAWETYFKVSLKGAPLFISTKAARLTDPMDAMNVSEHIDRMVEGAGHKPGLILIDTLARNYGEGDENTAKDMNKFIDNIDVNLRKKYQANVLIVHHSGHDGERARGSSALKAAMDQEFALSGVAGRLKLACTKMKDADVPQDMYLTIRQVSLGLDADGVEIVSAVADNAGLGLDFQVGEGPKGEKISASDVLKAFVAHIKSYPSLATHFAVGQRQARTMCDKMVAAELLVRRGPGQTCELSDKAIQLARTCGLITDDSWVP